MAAYPLLSKWPVIWGSVVWTQTTVLMSLSSGILFGHQFYQLINCE